MPTPPASSPTVFQVCKSGRLASTVTLPEVLSLQVGGRGEAVCCRSCWVVGLLGCRDGPARFGRIMSEQALLGPPPLLTPPPLCPSCCPRPMLQHLPIELAAAEVGVCVTTFKKVIPCVCTRKEAFVLLINYLVLRCGSTRTDGTCAQNPAPYTLHTLQHSRPSRSGSMPCTRPLPRTRST